MKGLLRVGMWFAPSKRRTRSERKIRLPREQQGLFAREDLQLREGEKRYGVESSKHRHCFIVDLPVNHRKRQDSYILPFLCQLHTTSATLGSDGWILLDDGDGDLVNTWELT